MLSKILLSFAAISMVVWMCLVTSEVRAAPVAAFPAHVTEAAEG